MMQEVGLMGHSINHLGSIAHNFVQAPKDLEVFKRADQLRRSSKSICANLVEGFAKQISSKREFARYVVISLGSCNEAALWLKYAQDLDYVSENVSEEWRKEYGLIARMLNCLHRSLLTSNY